MTQRGGEEQVPGARSQTPDVFISYASPDSAVADAACESLERAGVTCWIAPRDVTPGAFYADEIVHAIDAAKAIVLILSRHAAESPHVLREIERATSKRHPVVSLRIDHAPLPVLAQPIGEVRPADLDQGLFALGFRLRRGLNKHTMRQAGEACQMSAATVMRLERGEVMSIGVVLRCCAYIAVHPFGYLRAVSDPRPVTRETVPQLAASP